MLYGTGSSFDGIKYDNDAQNMRVLERWKCINPTHRSMIAKMMTRRGMKIISQKIFGSIPEGL